MSHLEHILPLVFHTFIGATGLLANGLLFYLAVKETPDSFKVYSILIINFSIFDFVACLTSLVVQQRVVPLATSLVFLSGGPCKFFGSKICYITHCVTLHCYSHTMWSLMLSFLFRYVVLKYRPPKAKEVLFVLFLFYIISVAQLVLYILAEDDPTILKQLLYESFPQYDISNEVISGNSSIFEWKAFIVSVHITCAVFPIYVFIIWSRNRILTILKSQYMSVKTKELHSQLLKALTYQAILPGVFSLAVISYGLGLFRICNHPLLEYSTFIVSGLLPVLSPLGTIFFVRPYKQWIYQKISCTSSNAVDPRSVPYSLTRNSGFSSGH